MVREDFREMEKILEGSVNYGRGVAAFPEKGGHFRSARTDGLIFRKEEVKMENLYESDGAPTWWDKV